MKGSFLFVEASSSTEPFKTRSVGAQREESHYDDGDDVQIHLLLEYIQFEVLQPINLLGRAIIYKS